MHVRADHMLPQLHVISRRHEASGSNHTPDNVTRSHLTESPPKYDMPVPLWQEIYMTFYAFGALVLSAYSPHMPTVVTSQRIHFV